MHLHPGRHRLARLALESLAEGAVTTETALLGQLLGGEETLTSDCLMIDAEEIIYTQIVDISIVGDALTGEILPQVGAVGADCLGKLGEGQHHEVLPQLLVLQGGVVVAQPVTVPPHLAYHIYNKTGTNQQEIDIHHRLEGITASGHAPNAHYNYRCHQRDDRSERPSAVLQHCEHHDDAQRNKRHAVEQSASKVGHRNLLIRDRTEDRNVPQVIQSEGSKEGCGPAAQTQRRCDIGGKCVALAEQQIAACHNGHGQHYAIKNNIECIFSDLIVHVERII